MQLQSARLDGQSRLSLGLVLAAIAAAACAGAAAASVTTLAYGLLALALLYLYAEYALSRPRGAVVAMVASLALIPVYAVPDLQAFTPEPTAILAAILAVVLVRVGVPFRPTGLDLVFAVLCGAMLLSALIGPATVPSVGSELFLWIPPYIAGRAIVLRQDGPQTLVLAAAIMGLVAVPFIVQETVTGHNYFFGLANSSSAGTELWAHPAFRGGGRSITGVLRSQGAFGHPLSMAMLIGSTAVFAIALAVRSTVLRNRILWLGAAVGLVAAQSTAFERSGWVVFAGGTLLFAASAIPSSPRVRYAFAGALLCLPLALLAISLAGTPGGTAQAQGDLAGQRIESANVRLDLYKHALRPGGLKLVGIGSHEADFANSVTLGRTSIDAAYLQIGIQNGWIALIPLLAVVLGVVRVAIRARGTWAAVIPAVALANLVALSVVGFQTQQPIFIWLLIGATSGVALRQIE
jgi:hypothetical protein